ncbi:MAG: TadE/TadG family type IV pilus assembly protein [Sphingomicrobium sp.]
MARRRSFVTDRRGAVVIELALVAPVLAVLAIGVVDMSNAFSRRLALEQGAQRAIEKIMQTTDDTTVEATLANEAVCQVNGVNSDGTCKTSPITTANVTVTYRIECTASGGAVTVQSNSDAAIFNTYVCASGSSTAKYLSVNVTDKYTPIFPLHFSAFDADGTYHIATTAGMRIQ